MSSNAPNAEVFVYRGAGGASIPHDVVRVRVDPSVTSIPADAFNGRKKLADVELSEGLVEIGGNAFAWCRVSITKIVIPNSLRRINNEAFCSSLQCPIHLHDGIESIGVWAFCGCIFTNFRVPPLITVIPSGMLSQCKSIFSVEIPKNETEIRYQAFGYCYCLRNMAFPPNAVIGDGTLNEPTDLLLLFGSISEIIINLKNRFNELPIHTLIYYQSYHQGVLQMLIGVINSRQCQLNLTGNQQDCLGMTPLHILACSSVHDIEVYRVIIDNYPTNLITEDGWGALPLLYALWGAAPTNIIQFLLESYQLHYPNHSFNWTMMVKTMGRTDTPKENIENLLCLKLIHFPEQPLNWGYLLDEFAESSENYTNPRINQERMQYLIMCGLSDCVEALPFKIWRDDIRHMIQTADYKWGRDNSVILHEIRAKVSHFEDELPKLKEITTILELTIWKLRINENITQEEATNCQKKIKTDESSIRQQCRVTCGADVVIGHMLPFLITV